MSTHLDLTGLADLLDGRGTDRQRRHLGDCPPCAVALVELRSAQEGVRSALAALAEPEVPSDLAARLDAALLQSREQEETPWPTRRRSRSTAGSALAAVVVTGAVAGLALSGVLTRSDGRVPAAAEAATLAGPAAPPADAGPTVPVADSTPDLPEVPALSTDVDYGTGVLAAVLPALLARSRTPVAAAVPVGATDPLARLRDPGQLSACLHALPRAHGQPLALDYARFSGTPALLAVFPAARSGRVEVVVVGPGCAPGRTETRYATELRVAPTPS